MWKISVAALALLLCIGAGEAAPRGGGGGGGGPHMGGGGGGGGMRMGGGGGAPHFGGGGGGAAPHFGGGGAPHIGGGGVARMGGAPGGAHFNFARPAGAPHFSARPSGSAGMARLGGQRFGGEVRHGRAVAGRGVGTTRAVHGPSSAARFVGRNAGRSARSTAGTEVRNGRALSNNNNRATANNNRANGRATTGAAAAGAAGAAGAAAAGGRFAGRNGGAATTGRALDPHAFAGRRTFAGNQVFGRFAGGVWLHHHRFHVGWVGPLFWPYAYGDLFYDTLWPSDYWDVDPFWDYGYNDIYQTIFWPYSDEEYVQGRSSRTRRTAVTHEVAQTCNDETGEVTGWPIDQIQDAVQPNEAQRAALDELGNAVVKASQVIRAACPTNIAFTPIGRLDQMQQRIAALVQAAKIVQPALAKFYDSLSDDQKARFNDMGTPGNASGETVGSGGAHRPILKATCGENVTPWPTDRVAGAVHPNDAQRAKLDDLQAAADKAAGVVKASCPSEIPATPPARLDAAIKRLDAMLQGIDIVRPALTDFYNSLDDEQKARFNRLGRELASANRSSD